MTTHSTSHSTVRPARIHSNLLPNFDWHENTEAMLIAQVSSLQKSVQAMQALIIQLHKNHGTRLRREDICQRFGIDRTTLLRWVKRRTFPPPCKDGKWLLATVLEWESSRAGD